MTIDVTDAQQLLRTAAARGELAAPRDELDTRTLRDAAFALAYPLVFERHTRSLERRKGHGRCASSIDRLSSDCLDGFHDDVAAVVRRLLGQAVPIRNLEGWLVANIGGASIDAHRRRRGATGALQRVRVPGWLATALGNDPWSVELAARIIEWVGLPASAGGQTWPVDAWTLLRRSFNGEAAGNCPTARVDAEIRDVLGIMRRTKPAWFADRIEGPLGHKQAPVAAGDPALHVALPGADSTDRDDRQLAALAVEAIEAGLMAGGDPVAVVREIVATVFLGHRACAAELAEVPQAGADRDEIIASLLADDAQARRIADDVLAALGLQ